MKSVEMDADKTQLAESLSALMDGEGSATDARLVLYALNSERSNALENPGYARQLLRQYSHAQQRMQRQGTVSVGETGALDAQRDISTAVMTRIADLPPAVSSDEQQRRKTIFPADPAGVEGRARFRLFPDSLRAALPAPFIGMAAGFALTFAVLLLLPADSSPVSSPAIATVPDIDGARDTTSEDMLVSLEQAIASSSNAAPAQLQPLPGEPALGKSVYRRNESGAVETLAGYETEEKEPAGEDKP